MANLVSLNANLIFVQAKGGPPDARSRAVTFHYGRRRAGLKVSKLVIRNQEPGGAFCSVSGIWFPNSRLRIDGKGRTVGDIFYTEAPRGNR